MTGAHDVRRRLARIASYGNPNLTFVFCCALCRRPDDRRYNAGLRFVNIASYVVSEYCRRWSDRCRRAWRRVASVLCYGISMSVSLFGIYCRRGERVTTLAFVSYDMSYFVLA
jgi:hypothetical protein